MHRSTFTLAIAAAASLLVAPAGAESLDGAYRGSYVCEKTQATQNILRVPIDLVVNGTDVRFGQPLLNLKGTRVTGTEMASGTIAAHGATFTGTQSWQWPDGRHGSRTCVAALVPAPGSTHPAAAQ